MKSPAYIAGFLAGIIVVFVIFLILVKITKKKNSSREKPKYDERQLAARGKAFGFGFNLYMLLEVAMMLCYGCDIALPFDAFTIHCSIFFIGFLGFIIFCIWTDAYFQIGENKRLWYAVIIFASALNIMIYFFQKYRKGEPSSYNLIIGIIALFTLANVIAKNIVSRIKDNKADEE